MDAYEHLKLSVARVIANRYNDMSARRVAQLRAIINATPGFRTWRPDFSEVSVARIDKWILKCWALERQPEPMKWRILDDTKLVREVHRRLQAREEPSYDFADAEIAYSACVDIACYLGALFIRRYPRLKWMAAEGGLTNRDYGMPVLAYKPNDYFLVAPVQVPISATRVLEAQACERGMLHLVHLVAEELRHAEPPPLKQVRPSRPAR